MIVFGLSLLFANIALVVLSKEKFGKCMPVSMILVTLILYLTQFIFNSFNVGTIVFLCMSLFGLGCMVYLLCKKEKQVMSLIMTEGFVSFVILIGFFGILDFHRTYTTYDEFQHWGKMVKEMLRLDTWYSVPESQLWSHKDYPPFASIFELLACKVGRRAYAEDICCYAIHMLEMSMIIPPLFECITQESEREKHTFIKRIASQILVIAIALVVISVFDASRKFNTINEDVLLSLMAVYALWLIYNLEDLLSIRKVCVLGIVLAAISITKQMGMVFVLISWIFYFSRLWIDRKRLTKTSKLFGTVSLILGIPMATWLSWSIYINNLNIGGQFEGGGIVAGIKSFLSGNSNDIVKNTLFSYIEALIDKNIVPDTSIIPLTFVVTWIIVIVAIYVIRDKGVLAPKDGLLLSFIFTMGTIGYSVTMGILYMFCFSEEEMERLASYTRYMSAYVLVEVLFLVMLVFEYHMKEGVIGRKLLIFILLGVTIFTSALNWRNLVPGVINNSIGWQNDVALFVKNNTEQNDTILIAYQDNQFADVVYINYYSDDGKFEIYNISNENQTEEDVWNCIADKKCDYVYILELEDKFADMMKGSCEDSLERRSIYKVDTDNKQLKYVAGEF